MIYGIIIAIVIALILWGMAIKKNIKNPDVLAASALKMNVVTYNRYMDLYERMLQNKLFDDKQTQKDFSEVMIHELRRWSKFCLKMGNSYQPKYQKGMKIRIYVPEEAQYVDGVIVDNRHFAFGWWEYVLIMDEAVGVNNSFPDKQMHLSEKLLTDIIDGKLTGSFCHFVY